MKGIREVCQLTERCDGKKRDGEGIRCITWLEEV